MDWWILDNRTGLVGGAMESLEDRMEIRRI